MVATSQSGDPTPLKFSVLCLTKYIPYQGITHAGGEYLEAHLAALREIAEVKLVAPPTPLNEASILRPGVDLNATLLAPMRPKLRGLFFKWFQVEATLAGCSIYWPVRQLFRGAQASWQQLGAADVIEFQWSEMIALAPLVRKRLPNARLVGVAHDINSQRWQRQADEESSWFRRVLANWIAKRTSQQESLSFGTLDALIVFSEKDAALARKLAPTVNVEVVHPGFSSKAPRRTLDEENPAVLFVGAMNRPENWGGVLWFLREIWPIVHSAVPTARFIVAGAHPPKHLVNAIQQSPNAELTGFVTSLDPYYSQASVCVVPIQTGAGVKFKTIDSMISGIPVVTTSVGAEGIDAPGLFVAVTDKASEFGEALVNELLRPDKSRAHEAQAWAEQNYGVASFAKRLEEVYKHVWNQ